MRAIDGARPTPEVVFVYGTLLKDQRSHHLLDGAERLGPATTRGLLYDLGDYPGLVKGTGTVHGEVYRLREFASALDDWEDFIGYEREGSLYRRVIGEVRYRGLLRWAWFYRYLGDLRHAKRIDSGNWRDAGPAWRD